LSRLRECHALLLLDLEDTEVVSWSEPEPGQRSELVPLFSPPRRAEPPLATVDPTPALLEAARQEGFAAGNAAGRAAAEADQSARCVALLGTVAATLAEGVSGAVALAEATAERMAGLMVAALGAALPSCAERLGAAEVAAFVAAMLPALAEDMRLELRVATGLQPDIAAQLAAQSRIMVVGDDSLAPGDATLRWRDGSAERRAAWARNAVLGAIDAFMADLAPRSVDIAGEQA
jgi:hypothetical protein